MVRGTDMSEQGPWPGGGWGGGSVLQLHLLGICEVSKTNLLIRSELRKTASRSRSMQEKTPLRLAGSASSER